MRDPMYAMKREMFRRRYSFRTISTYSYCVNQFLGFCNKNTKSITKKDVRKFMEYIMDKDYSGNTINVYFNAVKYFIFEILRKNWQLKVTYSKTPKRIQDFLTKDEVKTLINSIENRKHRLMIILMYSAGLRVSELVRLKVKDFDFDNNFGWVRHGKGNKDRLFVIAKRIKAELIGFIRGNGMSENSLLFKGRNGHITTRTVQQIIKYANRKAGIKKHIHPHTLRHSFATHIIENNNDILSVQSLLGHVSTETTMGYIHRKSKNMIRIQSPYDSL